MKIDKDTIPKLALAELGARILSRRIELRLTQANLAEQAGVGKRTLERIESGGDTQLTTLIRLLRVLGLSSQLNELVPEPTTSPMALLRKNDLPQPKRVRQRTLAKSKEPKQPWKWGDE